MEPIKSIYDLKVYTESYKLALDVFAVSKKFPKEELYSLTDQIRRSSRSVPMNIREGFAKKKYKQVFIHHLTDALGSAEETRGWIQFAKDFNYITKEEFDSIDKSYGTLCAMIYNLTKVWNSTE